MPSYTTTYLEVPKAYTHRPKKLRSASRSRPKTQKTDCTTQLYQFKEPSPPRYARMADVTYRPPMFEPLTAKYASKESSPAVKIITEDTITESPPPAPCRRDSHHTIPENLNSAFNTFTGDFFTSPDHTVRASPPPPPSLRSRLVGAWRLESYIAYPTPTSSIQRPTYPMTKSVTGLIMYTPDGYMSAQMLIPGQKSFTRTSSSVKPNPAPANDPSTKAYEESQWAEAGKRSFTYAGRYYISHEGEGREEVLRHTFQVCNLPGWIGDVQIRTWRFEEEGQVLVLGSEGATDVKGDRRVPVLRWRRAGDNSTGAPPPPVPQIKVSGPGEP